MPTLCQFAPCTIWQPLIFHVFPVDAAVRTEWMQKIRRDDFNPTKNTRVCSRHFKKTDFNVTARGLRRLKKGAVPVYFSWNGYKLPAPRPSVWERRPRAESPAPESDSDSEMETEMARDHDYCVVPQAGARASNLADENEALRPSCGTFSSSQWMSASSLNTNECGVSIAFNSITF
uniref:THAP domain-containing protein 1 n=1 Tax=Sander lucioperca TaxID=283035 RepID=A0A8C9YC65_SANLU